VNKHEAKEIEHIRKQFNPIQQQLIACHVTLCREEEIEDINRVLHNLQALDISGITMRFAPAARFADGKGVWLPAAGDNEEFHQLRLEIMGGSEKALGRPEPHITLMHPRNSTYTEEIFRLIQKADLPTLLSFDEVSLIEQVNGEPWETLRRYKLGGT
jgi:hypothetical protein